ncbi:MAG: Ig-like domain-containing protein, partial [Coriobacteriia bacterium]|nr:Ig-like domain-containing protein [Coriobacteriia bacterium]
MTAKMPEFRTRAAEPSGKPRLALLIAVIFLLAVPFLAVANSSAVQSVLSPVITQVQNMLSPADDAFVANETPALTTSGISSLSNSGFRPEPTTFSAGPNHSLAVKSDGTLWAWGQNYAGQTGLGYTVLRQLVPAQVGTATNWKAVSANGWYSLGIRTDGTLWAWGENSNGQLGITGMPIGSGSYQHTPTQVGTATNWAQVATGAWHSVGIQTDGTLWAWGLNGAGQTGITGLPAFTGSNQLTPAQVGTDTDWAVVSAGNEHSIALKTDGTLWAWGGGTATGLGISFAERQETPAQVGTATNWAAISAGGTHSMAIRSDGTLWIWGWNFGGQLGMPGLATGWGGDHLTIPTQLGTATNWAHVSAGGNHSHAIRQDGTLWAWGENHAGELGLGLELGMQQLAPAQVGTDTNWVSAATASGGIHVLATRTNSSLWGWGNNIDGQLGINDNQYRIVPTFIWGPPTIENITPQGRDVAITTTELVITFDQRMHLANLGTVTLNGTELNLATATWTDNDTVLTIPFADPLEYATGYEVTLLGFIVEMGRFTMTEPYVHHFVTEVRDLDLAITKNLLMPEGTVVPDTNFIFDITAYSYNGDTTAPEMADMPDLSVNPVAFSSTDTGTVDGDTTTITRWSDFLLGNDLPFPFAGLYVYRISEADDTFTNTDTETMIFDPTIYQITFQVENISSPMGGLFVRAIFLQLVVDGVAGSKIDITD